MRREEGYDKEALGEGPRTGRAGWRRRRPRTRQSNGRCVQLKVEADGSLAALRNGHVTHVTVCAGGRDDVQEPEEARP